ncbi:MAG: hypothetical protein H0X26_05710 [Alphaproteobacteria bacterium]|nr:hypothetical protein [Alphaproteobacteria bacterium]
MITEPTGIPNKRASHISLLSLDAYPTETLSLKAQTRYERLEQTHQLKRTA